MRVLITGATGFVGGHLARTLAEAGGHELHGLSRDGGSATDPVECHVADLSDRERVSELLREIKPERIFHLAGYAHGGKSFSEPAAAWAGNLTATMHFYDAIAGSGITPRVLYVSTGLVYGNAPAGGSWDEDSPLAPTSPYAASKAAADLLSYQVTRHPGLDVVRVRPFNHIGPGQAADYAVANFARQIAEIERGEREPVIETGDLSGCRDFTDVRDLCRAYVGLLERAETGSVYNAASGVSRRVGDVLDRLIELSGARVEVRQKIDPSRRGDVAVTRADVSKLKGDTGWVPGLSLDRSLTDILDWWRQGGVS